MFEAKNQSVYNITKRLLRIKVKILHHGPTKVHYPIHYPRLHSNLMFSLFFFMCKSTPNLQEKMPLLSISFTVVKFRVQVFETSKCWLERSHPNFRFFNLFVFFFFSWFSNKLWRFDNHWHAFFLSRFNNHTMWKCILLFISKILLSGKQEMASIVPNSA